MNCNCFCKCNSPPQTSTSRELNEYVSGVKQLKLEQSNLVAALMLGENPSRAIHPCTCFKNIITKLINIK